MDEDFTAFLARRGITETKYSTGSLGEQATVIAAFEKSKEGNCRNCFTEDFRIIYSVVSSFWESFVTISEQYPTTTNVPIESLRTCATILCLGVTINTTSSHVNTAVRELSVHSVRYDVASAILFYYLSTLKRRINVVDVEWLCLRIITFYWDSLVPNNILLQTISQLNLWELVSLYSVWAWQLTRHPYTWIRLRDIFLFVLFAMMSHLLFCVTVNLLEN